MAVGLLPVGSPVTARDGSVASKHVPEQDLAAVPDRGRSSDREQWATGLEDGKPDRAARGSLFTLSVVLCAAIQLRNRSHCGSFGTQYDFHRQNEYLGAHYFNNREPSDRGRLLELLGRKRGIPDQRADANIRTQRAQRVPGYLLRWRLDRSDSAVFCVNRVRQTLDEEFPGRPLPAGALCGVDRNDCLQSFRIYVCTLESHLVDHSAAYGGFSVPEEICEEEARYLQGEG